VAASSSRGSGALAATATALGLLLAVLATAAVTPAAAQTTSRHLTDQPDDAPGAAQVHVIYALPSDGTDRELDHNGTLAATVGSWGSWLAGQTAGRQMRLDTAGGQPDITFVRLDRTDAQLADQGVYIRDEIERQLRARGFQQRGKIYAVYYDGSARGSCGGGAWPPVLPGIVAAVYLHGIPSGGAPCDANHLASAPTDPPGYLEYAMIHEILHTLGFVATCAPHQTRAGHVSDSPTDLMYAGDQPWRPSVLDVGHDDYFATGRTDCPDLANSPFLTGGSHPVPPPGPHCVVPRLIGLRLGPARRALVRAHCALGRVRHRHVRGRRSRGRLVAQSPRAGSALRAGHRVAVTVAAPSR